MAGPEEYDADRPPVQGSPLGSASVADSGGAAALSSSRATPEATAALTDLHTRRLRLRRPESGDEPVWLALHTDPALYRHAPYARPTRDEARAGFEAQLSAWGSDGFGYWIVSDRATGARIGVAGVRPDGPGRLNLYYRLATAAHGKGLAIEAARAAVIAATEWLPCRIEALVKDSNIASIRTAERAGLDAIGADSRPDDPLGSGASTRYAAPTVARVDRLDDGAREQVLDLWCRVTEAGGSVGFLPGAPRSRVAASLADHEAQMASGRAFGVGLRTAAGDLVGWAWWVTVANPLLAHGRWLYRLMVDPAHQGRNFGALLMAGAHREARADGAELLQLGYRSGSGLGDFYARFGYAEVGRIPGAIRVAAGDDRDDVTMARRADGAPLRGDGCH